IPDGHAQRPRLSLLRFCELFTRWDPLSVWLRSGSGCMRPAKGSAGEVRSTESRYLLTTALAATLLVTTASARVRETVREPTVWHSEGGVLQRTLEMRRARTTLEGRKLLTLTYEGTIPGPTWRLAPGERIKVRLVNNMTPPAPSESGTATASPESLFTNIHVH